MRISHNSLYSTTKCLVSHSKDESPTSRKSLVSLRFVLVDISARLITPYLVSPLTLREPLPRAIEGLHRSSSSLSQLFIEFLVGFSKYLLQKNYEHLLENTIIAINQHKTKDSSQGRGILTLQRGEEGQLYIVVNADTDTVILVSHIIYLLFT